MELPALPGREVRAASIGGHAVPCEQANGRLRLAVPPTLLDPIDTVVRLELNGSAMDVPSLGLGSEIAASASNIYQGQADAFGPQQAFDNDPNTRWATDPGTQRVGGGGLRQSSDGPAGPHRGGVPGPGSTVHVGVPGWGWELANGGGGNDPGGLVSAPVRPGAGSGISPEHPGGFGGADDFGH